MASSAPVVLEYGRRHLGRIRALARSLFRMALVLLAACAIGGVVAWLIVPVVYVDYFLVYEQPPVAGSFASALATRASQLESPTFVATAVAPLFASGRLTAGDVRKLVVHAEVGRRNDIITVSVQHHDPLIAAAVSNALMTATLAPPQGASIPPTTSPTTQSAGDRLAQAVAALVKPTIVLQRPQPASQLGPQYTRRGWTLSALCMFVLAIAAVIFARKWIMSISSVER